MEEPMIYHRRDMLGVGQIRKMIPGQNGGPCSRQHIYNLIERGDLSPAFRFGLKKCLCVPRQVVEEFTRKSVIEVGL